MCSFSQTMSLHLPKILAESSRRNLHHLSPATAFYRKQNLLCPSSTTLTCTNSVRNFSEAILKSDFFVAVSDKLTQTDAVYIFQEKLITFQDISGLPWWAAIVTSTIAIRTLLFPLAVHQQRVIAKISNIEKQVNTTIEREVSKTVAELIKEKRWDEEFLNSFYHIEMYRRRTELYKKQKCHPWKTLPLVFIQIPVWVTMSGAIYNISSMLPIRDDVALQTYLEMKATGFSIFQDLTVLDDTYLLPLFFVFSNLSIIYLREKSVASSQNNLRTLSLILLKGFTLGCYPFIIYAPKCLILCWLTSSLFGLFQNILFVYPKTRKILGISQTDVKRKDPLERIKNRIKGIFYFFRY